MEREATCFVNVGPWLLAARSARALSANCAGASPDEQFFPLLVYRTGALRTERHPVRQRRRRLSGRSSTSATAASTASRSRFEECETGYATDKGVECYERLKGKGPTGAGYFSPLSTGITFALTEKAPGDKIPLLTLGYGRSESRDGSVFTWNFIAIGSYWTAADVAVQHIAKELGGAGQAEGQEDQPRLS